MLTVLPMSANFRSSKIMKSCFLANSWIFVQNSGVKSGRISTWVLSTQIEGPILSANSNSSSAVPTSAATLRFVFLRAISLKSSFATWFSANSALASYVRRLFFAHSSATFGRWVWLDVMKSFTFFTVDASSLPCFSSTSMMKVILHAEWSFRPWLVRCWAPPCSRSISTTTSLTFKPSALSGSTVSMTDIPLVTRSSTMRHVCPAWKAPSMAFFVP
mmetsp:Transcript_8030/g.49607  ORF Transcript_8030/g.49607 Transcript_8030/m.49607 type:complete len:217 (-) Transcript_8030:538-1188(-)